MKSSGLIVDIKAVKGQGAYYCEDLAALQRTPIKEADRWRAKGETEGFKFVREVAEVVSIGIKTVDGIWSWGDCVGVSYAGKSGREGIFRANLGLEQIEKWVFPFLKNKTPTTFREVMGEINLLPIHRAVKYGVSQALLKTIAFCHREEMWQTLVREWGINTVIKRVPFQGSSGNNRVINADKMIINRLSGLPHGQIDDIPTQLGLKGEILLSYASALKTRIVELGDTDYFPVVHLDVHGAIGKIFENNPKRIADYVRDLEAAVKPYHLRLESIALGNTQEETLNLFSDIKKEMTALALTTVLVADEWANTKEDILKVAQSGVVGMVHIKMPDLGGIEETMAAVLGVKKFKVATLLGGSCIETDLTARVSVHVALACQPTALLTKPGMGIDENIQIMGNEMNRALSSVISDETLQ